MRCMYMYVMYVMYVHDMYKVFAFYCGLFAQLTPSYCCLRRAMNANQTTFHANYQLTVTLYQRHTDWVLQNTNDTQTGYCKIPTTHRLGTAKYQRHTDWVLQNTNDTQTGYCKISTTYRLDTALYQFYIEALHYTVCLWYVVTRVKIR